MTKQDKRVKAERAAEQEAGRIIAEAERKVAAQAASPTEKPVRSRALAPELAAHADAIKAGRDAGTPWWRIAFDLGLPGSADNVAQGKSGAGLARRIYASKFGALPPRVVSEKTRQRRHRDATTSETVKAVRATPRDERIAKVKGGEAVLDLSLDDDAMRAALVGRTLVWSINLADMDGGPDDYSDDSATVHPRYCKFETHGGERCVAFRELDTAAKGDARMNPGPTRVVRLSRIHTVR